MAVAKDNLKMQENEKKALDKENKNTNKKVKSKK